MSNINRTFREIDKQESQSYVAVGGVAEDLVHKAALRLIDAGMPITVERSRELPQSLVEQGKAEGLHRHSDIAKRFGFYTQDVKGVDLKINNSSEEPSFHAHFGFDVKSNRAMVKKFHVQQNTLIAAGRRPPFLKFPFLCEVTDPFDKITLDLFKAILKYSESHKRWAKILPVYEEVQENFDENLSTLIQRVFPS